jgi:hypothetical protein
VPCNSYTMQPPPCTSCTTMCTQKQSNRKESLFRPNRRFNCARSEPRKNHSISSLRSQGAFSSSHFAIDLPTSLLKKLTRKQIVVLEERVNHDSALSRQRAETDRKKRHAADSPFPYPELFISLSVVTNTLVTRQDVYTFRVPNLEQF